MKQPGQILGLTISMLKSVFISVFIRLCIIFKCWYTLNWAVLGLYSPAHFLWMVNVQLVSGLFRSFVRILIVSCWHIVQVLLCIVCACMYALPQCLFISCCIGKKGGELWAVLFRHFLRWLIWMNDGIERKEVFLAPFFFFMLFSLFPAWSWLFYASAALKSSVGSWSQVSGKKRWFEISFIGTTILCSSSFTSIIMVFRSIWCTCYVLLQLFGKSSQVQELFVRLSQIFLRYHESCLVYSWENCITQFSVC